jgi:hypothetical protein
MASVRDMLQGLTAIDGIEKDSYVYQALQYTEKVTMNLTFIQKDVESSYASQ